MVTLTLKMKKQRIFAVGFSAFLLLMVLTAAWLGRDNDHTLQTEYILSGNTNDARVDFLGGYGWKAADEPCKIEDVLIPEEFSDTYMQYNQMQIEQGCDLSDYKSCVVKKYTYQILNYPLTDVSLEGTIYANLLVYQNEVIGGDVGSVALGGFMHGFEQPQ